MQSLNASNHIFGLDINYKLKYTHRKYSIWKEKKICEFIKFCKIRDASLLNGDTVKCIKENKFKRTCRDRLSGLQNVTQTYI